MNQPAKKLAVTAVRLAATYSLGPLFGSLFLAGSAAATKLLAETELGNALTETAAELTVDQAEALLNRLTKDFRAQRNIDLDTSMQRAAQNALAELGKKPPPTFTIGSSTGRATSLTPLPKRSSPAKAIPILGPSNTTTANSATCGGVRRRPRSSVGAPPIIPA